VAAVFSGKLVGAVHLNRLWRLRSIAATPGGRRVICSWQFVPTSPLETVASTAGAASIRVHL